MNPAKRYKNRVLASLPKNEINRLTPHLFPVTFKHKDILLDGQPTFAHFLEDGIASVVITTAKGETIEVGVIGVDGLVGIPLLLGVGTLPGQTFIQIEGSGFRIDAKILKAEFERTGELRKYLQKYIRGFMAQTAQTAVCNRLHVVEERLARWLLTCRDRMESDHLGLTHEFLSDMVGSPRSTVTLAAGLMEQAGLIELSRARVTIKNRSALENAACECYGVVRDEFKRLKLL